MPITNRHSKRGLLFSFSASDRNTYATRKRPPAGAQTFAWLHVHARQLLRGLCHHGRSILIALPVIFFAWHIAAGSLTIMRGTDYSAKRNATTILPAPSPARATPGKTLIRANNSATGTVKSATVANFRPPDRSSLPSQSG